MSSTALPRLSPAQRQVAGVLAEVHDATIIEITAAAGVSKSSVTKALAMLESAGAAARTIHTDGDVRLADTWSPTPLTGQVLMAAATADAPDGGDAEESLAVPAREPAAGDEAGLLTAVAGVVGDEVIADEPDEQAAFDSTTDVGAESREARARLAPGGLAQLVADVLAEHPFTEYTPTMLSHLLGGRSSGAISNALERQVKIGSATRVSDKPRRYRHVTTPADA